MTENSAPPVKPPLPAPRSQGRGGSRTAHDLRPLSRRSGGVGVRFLLLFLCFPIIARAQTPPTAIDVFLTAADGTPTLYFLDARTGLSTVVPAPGSRHTLLSDSVLYQEVETGAMRVAFPDGRISYHALLPSIDAKTAVHWVLSAGRQFMALSVTTQVEGGFSSDIYVAGGGADAANPVLALHTSSTQGVGVLPLAITDDGQTVFYTRRDDLFGDLAPVERLPVGETFRLTVATGQAAPLPNLPTCTACPAAFSPDGGQMFRLDGLRIAVWDVGLTRQGEIAPLRGAYLNGGEVLFSADNRFAAYVADTGGRRPRYAAVLVDLSGRSQRLLAEGFTEPIRPITFTPGNDGLIVVGVRRGATYRIRLADGLVTKLSDLRYLGPLRTP